MWQWGHGAIVLYTCIISSLNKNGLSILMYNNVYIFVPLKLYNVARIGEHAYFTDQ
jgi:hypothetical protein